MYTRHDAVYFDTCTAFLKKKKKLLRSSEFLGRFLLNRSREVVSALHRRDYLQVPNVSPENKSAALISCVTLAAAVDFSLHASQRLFSRFRNGFTDTSCISLFVGPHSRVLGDQLRKLP
jgi:hypothetical protein